MESPLSPSEGQQPSLPPSTEMNPSAESDRPMYSEQETLRFLQSTLDALISHVAVLDGDGTIVAVNRAWRRFMEANQGALTSCGLGANYLKVCDTAFGDFAQEAHSVAQGIRAVMSGQRAAFSLEYPCPSPNRTPLVYPACDAL